MKFSTKEFFSKCDQSRRKLRNYVRLCNKKRAKITHYSQTLKYFFCSSIFPSTTLCYISILYTILLQISLISTVFFEFEYSCISLRCSNLSGRPVPDFSEIDHPVSFYRIFSVSPLCPVLRTKMILFFSFLLYFESCLENLEILGKINFTGGK